MEQALILKGVGLFATLLGIYQWVVSDAQPGDVVFILVVTVLLVLMDVEKKQIAARKKQAEINELNETKILNKTNLA